MDTFDFIEDLKIAAGPLVSVLTATSLHGALADAWVMQHPTAKATLEALRDRWCREGLPTYAQFDNASLFQGAHQFPDTVGRVSRLCLALQVTPVFAPPREHGFQNAIEGFNALWQCKVWQRHHCPDLASLAVVSARYIAAHRSKTAAQSDYNRLAELGAAVGAKQNRDNLLQQYKLAYGLAPTHIQQELPEPPTLLLVETARLVELVDFILAAIRDSLIPHILGVILPPTQATCEAENGYEDGTDQDAGSCAGYAISGIMRNVSFPLRDDLTCVKNQGRRGTCVAFGSTAAIETGVHVMNGNKVNLSEQHAAATQRRCPAAC